MVDCGLLIDNLGVKCGLRFEVWRRVVNCMGIWLR